MLSSTQAHTVGGMESEYHFLQSYCSTAHCIISARDGGSYQQRFLSFPTQCIHPSNIRAPVTRPTQDTTTAATDRICRRVSILIHQRIPLGMSDSREEMFAWHEFLAVRNRNPVIGRVRKNITSYVRFEGPAMRR